jgi:2-amino-4-hydroxy-6-hydroxymethyldihydropteridine diphosphokinase
VGLARIGLGSNAGDAVRNVERALAALGRLGTVEARSGLYRSPPWGVLEQADFINAAALLETPLGPRELLGALKALEGELGRVATFRWGPRVIDLDILAYDELTIDEPDLVIPHPRLAERAFAVVPLAEIDPAFAAVLDALGADDRRAVQRIRASAARRRSIVNWEETLERVRSAAAFCASAGLTRFRIEEEDLAIEVRRPASAVRPVAQSVVAETATRPNGAHLSSNGSSSGPERATIVLRAEFVGIVRFARPTVVAGALVGEDRELAYVEALGIRNPVRSGGAGRVSDIFVSDGQAVEYGQALFSIEA